VKERPLHLGGTFYSKSNVRECVGHVGGKRRVSCRVLWGSLKERVYLEHLGIDKSIILKLILNVSVGRRSDSG
jgi:hypothetical protein